MRSRIKKYKLIYILLCISFMVTILLAGIALWMEYDKRYTQWVRDQYAFQYAYSIEYMAAKEAEKIPEDEILSSMPQIRHGVLFIEIEYNTDELAQADRVSYLFGDYGQVAYPLADGGKLEIQSGESGVFVGGKHLDDMLEKDGERYLSVYGNLLLVDNILADVTGMGLDERILIFGIDYPQVLKHMLCRALHNGNAHIQYVSNSPAYREELEQIAAWYKEVCPGEYVTEPIDPSMQYDSGMLSLGTAFISMAVYPALLCCLCNCLLLVRLYARSMQRNMAIRRMCGMSYLRIAVMTAADYSIIFAPAVLIAGLLNGYMVEMLALGSCMTFLFSIASVAVLRAGFIKKGRCI